MTRTRYDILNRLSAGEISVDEEAELRKTNHNPLVVDVDDEDGERVQI